jgi:hypothetical protein
MTEHDSKDEVAAAVVQLAEAVKELAERDGNSPRAYFLADKARRQAKATIGSDPPQEEDGPTRNRFAN